MSIGDCDSGSLSDGEADTSVLLIACHQVGRYDHFLGFPSIRSRISASLCLFSASMIAIESLYNRDRSIMSEVIINIDNKASIHYRPP